MQKKQFMSPARFLLIPLIDNQSDYYVSVDKEIHLFKSYSSYL